jgi:radical SAM superfamily enzyme YgiQ (UPF0313 family)
MKVTFLIPPSKPIKNKAPDRNFGCNYGITFQIPIHLLYPAAVLENEFEVKFIDCPVEGKNEKWVKKYIKESYTDVFVFYTVYLAEEIDKYWTEKIIEINPNCKVIFIGPEPTARPADFLLNENVFIIRGEPEITIKELVKEFEKSNPNCSKIKGLSWKKDNKVINNPPRHLLTNKQLDELPFPARHLIMNPNKYFNPKLTGMPTTTMLTSRGCWGNCIYCIPMSYTFARKIEFRKNFGVIPPVGLRSPKNIYEEFKQIKKLGYKSVAIMDDNFMGSNDQNYKKRIMKLCELIKPLKIEWGCLARADQLQDENVLRKMKEAGCVYVDIGVESLNQKVLDYVRKGETVGDQLNAIILLKKVGIEPKINILFGTSPLETEESIKWTVKVLKDLDIEWVSFGVVIPHREIDFYKIVKENKLFATKSGDFYPADPYREATVDFPNMSHEKLGKLVRWAYRDYYLRPQYIWKRLIKLRGFRDFRQMLESTYRLLF